MAGRITSGSPTVRELEPESNFLPAIRGGSEPRIFSFESCSKISRPNLPVRLALARSYISGLRNSAILFGATVGTTTTWKRVTRPDSATDMRHSPFVSFHTSQLMIADRS